MSKKSSPKNKIPAIRRAARPLTADALLTLATIMYDPGSSTAARLKAANSLLEWGWGKPGPDTTVQRADDPDGDLLMDEELYTAISQTFKKISKLSSQMQNSLTGVGADANKRIHKIVSSPNDSEDVSTLPQIEPPKR